MQDFKEVNRMADRAVFYARVSTEEEKQLNAIELQIEENRKAIQKKGWELVDEYVDRGKSGTKVKGRDEYQRLLDDMELGKFDIVVIKDQERLMRNTLDWYLFINRLVQTGKRLFMYLENKSYSPEDALITGIKAIIAEDFSRNLHKKLRNFNKGRFEKAKAGDTSIVLHSIWKAYGFKKAKGKDNPVELDPEQSKVKRLACELTLQGKGSTEVAKILNDRGYRNTVGSFWATQDIPRLVYDSKNVGTVILNQKTYDFEAKKNIYTDPSEWIYLENAVPAILSAEEWERLQEIKKQRTTIDRARGKKAGKSPFFSGKLVCGCCGKPYWRKTKKNDADDEFWVCSTKQTKGRMTRARDAVAGQKGEVNEAGCDNANITTKALMEIAERATVVLSEDVEAIKADRIKWLEGLKKSILEANNSYTDTDLIKEEKRKDKLLDALLDGLLTKEEYSKKAESIDAKIEEIKAEIASNKSSIEDIAEIDKVLDNIDEEIAVWMDNNKHLKVEYILEQMSGVVIYPDAVKIGLKWTDTEVLVKKVQFVKDRNANFQQHDGALHQYALSPVWHAPEAGAWAF